MSKNVLSLRHNYLWGRPAATFASIRDGSTDVLCPDVVVGTDVNMDAIATIVNVVGRDHRVGRARSRPTTVPASPRANGNPLQINKLSVPAVHAPTIGREVWRPMAFNDVFRDGRRGYARRADHD